MNMRQRARFCWLVIQALLCFSTLVQAKRKLVATSLVTCMENSQLSSNSFDVVFDPDDRSLHYTLDLTTDINSYIYADIDVYAYGFKIITKNVDLCNINWKQFCPVHPGRIEIESIEYLSQDLVADIPGIAYQVPDIDAYAKVYVYSNTSEYLACIQVFFSNGKTVSQTGVKWATAVVAGIGLLLSALLSTFGNSTAASHISANTMSLFLYFQSVVVVSMQHVHRVPPIAAAWSENLVWSMGLIKIHFMQKIFRWFIDSTGGTSSLNLTATNKSVLTQRSLQYVNTLFRRANDILYGNRNTSIFRGIKRMGYMMGIENTNIVATGFTFFVLCGYVLAGFIMVCKYSIELSIRAGWMKPNRFVEFRQNWKLILKGALLRYIYIGFTQLTILSFWEFTEVDSGAVVTIACLFVVLSVGLMAWSSYRTWFFARKSIQEYNNPAALLYGDQFVLHKYGFIYTMFKASFYWWNVVLLGYVFVKSLFLGFAQGSGQTQALTLFILDLFYFVALIYYKPYLDKPTNIMNIFICAVTLVNSFLFLFFSDLFKQPYKVSAVMGWIFFIMNAAFSFLLLMMIIAFTLMIVFSKNPDLRFKAAKDDRTSFQRHTSVPDEKDGLGELAALGELAKDHDDHWEDMMDGSSRSPGNIFASDTALIGTNDPHSTESNIPLDSEKMYGGLNNEAVVNDPFEEHAHIVTNGESTSVMPSNHSNLNDSDDELIDPFRDQNHPNNPRNRDSLFVESQSFIIPSLDDGANYDHTSGVSRDHH
ncbi:putative flavin adenine dinucleotide transporter KNAG_0F01820 [Huiozyma naganishii CBS 8797]|uniref:ML-like domain-containing protein n=1 Tax=Huiozyma naganishii (strain ATCC MYA-139 / BCRC 22969 / CBS 8797 / KCTC 17520 / NBRC 10181 / NCYC 3082 / Yp74L-3) TaxID=1071383 RepID=J7R7K2_HUIN7|nr:hypothetical protein KNAG_0F01820 [Kazachstania naganishii CBS 8797]CCK70850.1 hypothetical protein KNAG_0F01820 [Kazachstania naganishii CBS 8797]